MVLQGGKNVNLLANIEGLLDSVVGPLDICHLSLR